MSDGLNRVILLGNLGSDPELRRTAAGLAVLNLNVATNESYIDKNKEKQDRTEWHQVVIFGLRAEALAKHLSRGSKILVEGWLRTTSFENNGVKRYRTEVVAREICFADGRPATAGIPADDTALDLTLPGGSEPQEPARKNGKSKAPRAEPELDEIPF